jgi:hypothetical protein
MCTICNSDPENTDGLCRDCAGDGLRPGEPIEKDWRRCRINGQWTGILHIPSWTTFEIDRNALTCRIFSQKNGRVKPTAEELMNLRESALLLFLHGNLSRHSASYIAGDDLEVPERVARKCRRSWGLHL